MGKEDATNGVHLNKHIYLLHTCTYIQPTKAMNVGWDEDTSKAKTLEPTIIYHLQALAQFYL